MEELKSRLLQERESWRGEFAVGVRPFLLELYERERESGLWRSSLQMERLAEYALWLESQLKNQKEGG